MGEKEPENGGKAVDTLRTFCIPILLDSRVRRLW